MEIIQPQPRGFGANPAFYDFNAGQRGGGRSWGILGALAVLVIRQVDRTEPAAINPTQGRDPGLTALLGVSGRAFQRRDLGPGVRVAPACFVHKIRREGSQDG